MSNGRRQAMGRMVRGSSRAGLVSRIVIALVIAAFAYFKFLSTTDVVMNPYTGENQRISLTPDQEIALGLQAVPQMAGQHGGLHQSQEARDLVERIGRKLVAHTNRLLKEGQQPIPYQFNFYLLADEEMINAFALPGGQVFITAALFKKLENEDQLAGVLGHEIGHVIAKHSNEQMAKDGLFQGIGSAVGVAVSGGSSQSDQHIAGMVNHVLSTKYGRQDEYDSDEIGATLMFHAGYDPREILGVMRILKDAGGAGGPEIMSSHPFPENRIDRLRNEVFPKLGVSL